MCGLFHGSLSFLLFVEWELRSIQYYFYSSIAEEMLFHDDTYTLPSILTPVSKAGQRFLTGVGGYKTL